MGFTADMLREEYQTISKTLIGLKTINSQKCSFYQNSSFSVFESFRPLWLKREASFCFKREKSALFLQIVYYYTQFLSKVHLWYSWSQSKRCITRTLRPALPDISWYCIINSRCTYHFKTCHNSF
jgi:hypothetical protein